MAEPDLASLDDKYRLILCDLWGCVHNGTAQFDGVLDLCRRWREQGRSIVFLTNAPRPVDAVVAQLDGLGIGQDCYDAVTSSGDAALAYIARHHAGETFGFIGQAKDRDALSQAGIDLAADIVADLIVCCGFHEDRTDDLDSYQSALEEAKARGATMLCFNPDIFVIRGSEKELCAGAIAQRYEALGGEVIYFGKPAGPIYDRAFELASDKAGTAFAPANTLAIGDNMATDLAGAAAYGLDFLFVANGVEAERIADHGTSSLLDSLKEREKHKDFRLLAVVDGLR